MTVFILDPLYDIFLFDLLASFFIDSLVTTGSIVRLSSQSKFNPSSEVAE
jgi:hypothetical protein